MTDSPVVRLHPAEWRAAIRANELESVMETRDIQLEYRLLRYLSETPSHFASIRRNDIHRDRWADIRCYEHNRVVLPPNVEQVEDFYINASFIASPSNPRAFIASQAPLPRTMEDFFRILTAYNVQGIFCLTGDAECDSGKCHRYWPSLIDQPLRFGAAVIHLLSVESTRDFTRRKLKIDFTHPNEIKSIEVDHVQFQAWPDHGVPDLSYVESLHCELARLAAINPRSPVSVHCSAGVGRTGCLIAISNVMEGVEATGDVRVLDTVLNMRNQRPYMVQTTGQYELIYNTVSLLLNQS
jgi:protein tyrosine phosphatase